ncbi:MAG: sporulation integral membrane protein YtvI [Thermincolia bacterium]
MEQRIVKIFYLLIIVALLYFTLPYLMPFVLALVLAIIMEPMVRRIEGYFKVQRVTAVSISFILFLLVIFLTAFLGSTKIIGELMALIKQLPDFINQFGGELQKSFAKAQLWYKDIPPEAEQSLDLAIKDAVDFGNQLIKQFGSALLAGLQNIPNLLIVFIVTLVSFYLISLGLYDIRDKFLNIFTENAKGKVQIILTDVNKAIVGFVRAQIIVSFLTYLFVVAGLLVLGVNYALGIGLVIIIVDILPILGTGAVIVPWAIYLFLIGETFVPVGLLVLWALIIVFRRVIEPKIFGKHIGLGALATVTSMYLGFKVIGLVGLFVGPTLIIIFNAMRKAGLFQQKIDF